MKYQQSQNNFLIKHNGWDNKTIYNVQIITQMKESKDIQFNTTTKALIKLLKYIDSIRVDSNGIQLNKRRNTQRKMREERDTDKSRIYILQNDLGDGTKVGTTIREMSDGGYETEDEDYTYYWWTEIENNPNWKRIDK